MPLTKGKHIVKEVEDVRCVIIETGISQERVQFLTELLEHNGYEVKKEEEKQKEEEENLTKTYILGVTDLTFNPVIAVYQRGLLTKDGRKVTPAFWKQETETTNPNYWLT